MPEGFSAYLSIFNDWDLLEISLRSIAPKIDEIVVVDGAYEWMYPFLRKLNIDPEHSDKRVLDAVRACGVPVKIITGRWSNEVDKRIAGYNACSYRYRYRIDADEVIFFDEQKLELFLKMGDAVARMEMPVYVAPGWILAGPGDTPVEQIGFLFDSAQISAAAHLRYIWLILCKDTLPEISGDLPPPFPFPIAFAAHLTNWRTPQTSVNRSSFYTLNYMRHYHTPWAHEDERVPIGDFQALFETLSASDFQSAFLMNDIATGQVTIKEAMNNGAVLRESPIGREADTALAPIHARFLDSLAELNIELANIGRAFTRYMTITIDLSTDRSTDALISDSTLTLEFTMNLSAARAVLRYLIPKPPWQITIDPDTQMTGASLVVIMPEVQPVFYLRRCLEINVWSTDLSVIQRVRCPRSSRPSQSPMKGDQRPPIENSSSPSTDLKLAEVNKTPELTQPLLRHVTLESVLEWFEKNGGETDREYMAAHFDRFQALKNFTLGSKSSSIRGRMKILDIGAHWLHQALFFANEGHELFCADLHATFDVPAVQSAAKAMGATLIVYDRLDRGEGILDLAEDSIDIVLFCEILAHLAFNPITMWRTIYRALKPGGRVIISTPNATNLIATRRRLEEIVGRGQVGLSVDEVLQTGNLGHPWKIYSVAEIEKLFTTLSGDFMISNWTTWGSSHQEAFLSLITLIGETETPGQHSQDPINEILRKMARKGHPMLGSHIFLEITLKGKNAGISIRPPWEF